MDIRKCKDHRGSFGEGEVCTHQRSVCLNCHESYTQTSLFRDFKTQKQLSVGFNSNLLKSVLTSNGIMEELPLSIGKVLDNVKSVSLEIQILATKIQVSNKSKKNNKLRQILDQVIQSLTKAELYLVTNAKEQKKGQSDNKNIRKMKNQNNEPRHQIYSQVKNQCGYNPVQYQQKNEMPNYRSEQESKKQNYENVIQSKSHYNNKQKINNYSNGQNEQIHIASLPHQKIFKDDIIEALSTFGSGVKSIVLQGLNQFDDDCLKVISQRFPNLKKLNHIYNYQQNAMKLELEQVFYEKSQQIQENSFLSTSQNVFNLYGELKNLQNLYIGNIQKFTGRDKQIKNKKIKHLTLGDQITTCYEYLPDRLISQVKTKFENLITLNLFNICDIPETLISSLIKSNIQLQQIWLSQCDFLHENLFKTLHKSKLKRFIIDQVKIKGDIPLPATLETLLIDNCEIKGEIFNFRKLTKLRNFSLFQSQSQKIDYDQIIQKLAIGCQNSLSYLNLGKQSKSSKQDKSITNNSIKLLTKFKNLKYLCLTNTKIILSQIPQYFIFKNIRKLDIIGLPKCNENSIKKIEYIFPKVERLMLTYKKQYQFSTFKKYKNLKSIVFMKDENRYPYNQDQFNDLMLNLRSNEIEVKEIEKSKRLKSSH